MISAPLLAIIGAVLYVYARRYGGSPKTLWAGWQTPPRWTRVMFGAKNDQILLNDLLIEVVGMIWMIVGFALVVSGSGPGSSTFTAATAFLLAVLLLGGLAAISVWVARELWHRT